MAALSNLLSFLLLTLFQYPLNTAAGALDPISLKIVPEDPVKGPVQAQFNFDGLNFDGPKLSAVNTSAFEWWFFDAVSADLKTSAVFIFYTALNTSFPLVGPFTTVLSVSVRISFPDGSQFRTEVPADLAVLTTIGQGTSGEWIGSGSSFEGSPDLSKYRLNLNNPDAKVTGFIEYDSIGPAHGLCGLANPGLSFSQAPHYGWANAVPDAIATVDLVVNGTKLKFVGSGYHDQDWSDKPFIGVLQSFVWGHIRLGPYSIVYSSTNGTDHSVNPSIYVAVNGTAIVSACSGFTIDVTPTNSSSVLPSVFTLSINVPDDILKVTLTGVTTISSEPGIFARRISSVAGELQKEHQSFTGYAVNEILIVPSSLAG